MNAEELHQRAMESAERAFVARHQGDVGRWRKLIRRAFSLETQAAEYVRDDLELEPTRSVLFRSAASLALHADENREAERLVCEGLRGNPSEDIADELRDLLETIHFERHLEVKGEELTWDELQLAIAGGAIGHGVAEADEVVTRIRSFEKLLFRTTERVRGKRYREHASASKDVTKPFGVYLSALSPGSLTVRLKLGRPRGQRNLKFDDEVEKVIDEMMGCLHLANEGDENALKKRIPSKAYRKNFVGLARQLAPTGDTVTSVGLTVTRGGKRRSVSIGRSKHDMRQALTQNRRKKQDNVVTVRGRLSFADATGQRDQIKIIDGKGKEHRFVVPKGMMSDIVKPLWEELVEATGVVRANRTIPELTDVFRQ